MIPKDRAVFRHGVVVDPDFSKRLIRSRQLKDLTVYADRIVLGKDEFPFTASTRSIENGLICLRTPRKEVWFAARGFGDKHPNLFVTQTVWELIDAVESRDEAGLRAILTRVKRSRRRLAVTGALIVFFLVVYATLRQFVFDRSEHTQRGWLLLAAIVLTVAAAVTFNLLIRHFAHGASGVPDEVSKKQSGT